MVNTEEDELPHDAHVVFTKKLFRDVGFDISAMCFPRSPEALEALRTYNRVPETWVHPWAWNYHPNQWCKDHWEQTGRLT